MLSKDSVKVLKFINKNSPANIETLRSKFKKFDLTECVDFLISESYIRGLSIRKVTIQDLDADSHKTSLIQLSPYELTSRGKAALEKRNEDTTYKRLAQLHDWINTIIAVLAFLLALLRK